VSFTVADPGNAGRRRSPRIDIKLEASLSGKRRRSVAVIDLSRTGCLVQCDNLLDHGEIFDLLLPFEEQPFTAQVRVTEAYVDGTADESAARRYLAGLEFIGLPAREEERLRRFLEQERRRRPGADAPAE
jgi:c-di-GMP-binding flagellar brake protein YcgR